MVTGYLVFILYQNDKVDNLNVMNKVDNNKVSDDILTATPELEDFRGKYQEGRIGQKLLNNYFKAVENLINKTNIKDEAKTIEIGCGEGLSTQRLRKLLSGKVQLEASEYVEHQIPYAKKNNPGMKITQENIYELKHKNDKFKMIFILEVLEHLDHPVRAIKEVKRTIKSGGYIIVGVPREPLWRFLNITRAKYLKDLGNTPGHLNHWSRRTLVELIEKEFGEVLAVKNPIPWTLLLARKN